MSLLIAVTNTFAPDGVTGPDWIDSAITAALAGGGIFLLGRLAITGQWQLIRASQERNETLEDRVDKLEAEKEELAVRLDRSLDGHRECEAHLHEHKIESAAELAGLRLRIADLERIIERRNLKRRDQDHDQGEPS